MAGQDDAIVAVGAPVDRGKLSVIEARAGTIEVLKVESPPTFRDLDILVEPVDAGDELNTPLFDGIALEGLDSEAENKFPAFEKSLL